MDRKQLILHKLSKTFLKAWNKIFWPSPRAEVHLKRDNSILFLKNGKNLILPGGRLETREKFEEAAKRETKEETGIDIKILNQRQSYVNSIGDIVIQFEAEIGNEPPKLEGNWEGEPKWIEEQELEEYNLHSEIQEP
jgi:ADP-ribose pyrophosphatase YjhB (NUDIX family)